MGKFKPGTRVKRPYGDKVKGLMEAGEHAVPICVRSPRRDRQKSGLTYVLVHGLFADDNFMREAAHAAVEHGHTAVTVKFPNTNTHDALAKNARAVAAVIDSLPKRARLAAIAHSMGAAVLIDALGLTNRRIEAVTLVAPARCLSPEHSRLIADQPLRLLQELGELAALGLNRNVRTTASLAVTALGNCVRRLPAVLAESWGVLHGNVHAGLSEILERPDAPSLRCMAGDNDKVIPEHPLRASLAHLPIPIFTYAGGHLEIGHNRAVAHSIYAMDARAAAGLPEFVAPSLAA